MNVTEIAKIEGEVKNEFEKFAGWVRTLELKFFNGKLHQKVESGHPPQSAWIPVESHDGEAPKPGEPIVSAAPPTEQVAISTDTETATASST